MRRSDVFMARKVFMTEVGKNRLDRKLRKDSTEKKLPIVRKCNCQYRTGYMNTGLGYD